MGKRRKRERRAEWRQSVPGSSNVSSTVPARRQPSPTPPPARHLSVTTVRRYGVVQAVKSDVRARTQAVARQLTASPADRLKSASRVFARTKQAALKKRAFLVARETPLIDPLNRAGVEDIENVTRRSDARRVAQVKADPLLEPFDADGPTCKARPTQTRGGGNSRPYVPWCDKGKKR